MHCVFCGKKLAAQPRVPVSSLPFGQDVPRPDAFALGVINSSAAGFPDTLRQFRVRPRSHPDSLAPVSESSEVGVEPERAPWRHGSFWGSLGVGLAAGVALASGFTSLPRQPARPRPAAAVAPAAPPPAAAVAGVVASAAPTCAAVVPAATALVKPSAPKAWSPVADRRWLLERARAEQRRYRLSESERLYRQVLRSSPRDSEALAGLGELGLLRGTVDVAAVQFEQALEVNADYIPALIAMADIRWQSGQLEQARQAYLRIVESYSADLYPPYVAQRSQGIGAPNCDQAPGELSEPGEPGAP